MSDDPLDRAEIERAAHAQVNRERQARGLVPLEFSEDVRGVARYHSEDMASSDYFAHDAPDGGTQGDRFARFNVDCGDTAENIAWTLADGDVQTQQGTVNHGRNETAIGQGLVSQWMHSPQHRDYLLSEQWTAEGIGVATASTDSGTRVYATQNFCERAP